MPGSPARSLLALVLTCGVQLEAKVGRLQLERDALQAQLDAVRAAPRCWHEAHAQANGVVEAEAREKAMQEGATEEAATREAEEQAAAREAEEQAVAARKAAEAAAAGEAEEQEAASARNAEHNVPAVKAERQANQASQQGAMPEGDIGNQVRDGGDVQPASKMKTTRRRSSSRKSSAEEDEGQPGSTIRSTRRRSRRSSAEEDAAVLEEELKAVCKKLKIAEIKLKKEEPPDSKVTAAAAPAPSRG
jgi:hypothetical protein